MVTIHSPATPALSSSSIRLTASWRVRPPASTRSNETTAHACSSSSLTSFTAGRGCSFSTSAAAARWAPDDSLKAGLMSCIFIPISQNLAHCRRHSKQILPQVCSPSAGQTGKMFDGCCFERRISLRDFRDSSPAGLSDGSQRAIRSFTCSSNRTSSSER